MQPVRASHCESAYRAYLNESSVPAKPLKLLCPVFDKLVEKAVNTEESTARTLQEFGDCLS
jgi:hypothetical protein